MLDRNLTQWYNLVAGEVLQDIERIADATHQAREAKKASRAAAKSATQAEKEEEVIISGGESSSVSEAEAYFQQHLAESNRDEDSGEESLQVHDFDFDTPA